MIFRKLSVLARLAGVAGLLLGLGVPGVAYAANAQGGTDALFEEVPLNQRIEAPLTLSGRSPEEIADLRAAKAILTEFFLRFNPRRGKSALELMTEKYRSQYANDVEFFRKNIQAEALVSYRIFNYAVYHDRGVVAFQYFLRTTTEGVDIEEQRSATLIRMNDGKWKIDTLQQGD